MRSGLAAKEALRVPAVRRVPEESASAVGARSSRDGGGARTGIVTRCVSQFTVATPPQTTAMTSDSVKGRRQWPAPVRPMRAEANRPTRADEGRGGDAGDKRRRVSAPDTTRGAKDSSAQTGITAGTTALAALPPRPTNGCDIRRNSHPPQPRPMSTYTTAHVQVVRDGRLQ